MTKAKSSAIEVIEGFYEHFSHDTSMRAVVGHCGGARMDSFDIIGGRLDGSEIGIQRVDRIGSRLAASAALLWVTTLFLRVLQLANTTILARILDPSDYGLLAIAMVVVGFLDVLSNLQVGSAIIKTKQLTREHLDTAFTLNLIRAALSALAMVAAARPVSVFMHEPRLTNILYALAVPALVGGLHNPHFLLFARNLNFSREMRRDALTALMGSGVGITAALMFHSYWALVLSSVVAGLTWSLSSYWRVPGRPRLCLTKSREILSYGSWLMLIGVLDFINWRIDYIMIGKAIGTRALGAYNVGQALTNAATGDVVSSLGRALFPAFSILSHDLERLRAGYRRIQSITLAIALPIGFGLSAVAGNMVLLLVGRKWELAIPVIAILAPLAALQTMVASIESLALSMNKGRLLLIRTLVFVVFRVAVMFVGFYLGGYIGIIYARVVSGVFSLVYGLGLAASITHGRWYDPVISSWRSFVAVALMWVGVTQLPWPPVSPLATPTLALLFIVKLGVGAILYLGTHGLLWQICGRPDGAESRLIQQIMQVFDSLRQTAKPTRCQLKVLKFTLR